MPFYPFFAINDVYTLRFGKDKNNNFLIKEYYDRSGMIIGFGAGSSGQSYYVYKKIENK